jgi:hypothetical protein
VNVPPGTEGETAMSNTAAARYLEDPNPEEETGLDCPRCGGGHIDIAPTEEGYDIYCEDCEDVTYRGTLAPAQGITPMHSDETMMREPEDELEQEPEPEPDDIFGTFISARKEADLFEEPALQDIIDPNVVFAMSEEEKGAWLMAHGWQRDDEAELYTRTPQWHQPNWRDESPSTDTENAVEETLEHLENEREQEATWSACGQCGAEMEPPKWFHAKGCRCPECQRGPLCDQCKGVKTSSEECRSCGEPLNNAEGELCGRCLAEGAEDREDPFDKSAEEDEEGMSVGRIILEQLGGRKFIAMTGAKNFSEGPNSLSFRLPGGGGFTKNGINAVMVRLEPSDTYRVTYYRIRGGQMKVVSEHDDIYADSLRENFERETGLRTSMGNVLFSSKEAAGSNSGNDDDRGAGDLWREEFYEHRTSGPSAEGLMAGGIKEAQGTAVAPSVAQAPNVAQNMAIAPRPQVTAPPGGTSVAIVPNEGEQAEEPSIGRHTVEPELPNAKYHMMSRLAAAEETRLMKEAGELMQCSECGKIDPTVEIVEFPDLGNAEGTGPLIVPVCPECELGIAQDI